MVVVYIEDIKWPAEIQNFSSSVEKYFKSDGSEGVKYFSTLEEKLRIFKRACNVLFILYISMKYQGKHNRSIKETKFTVFTSFR